VNEFLEQVASEGGAATFDVGALIASGEDDLVEFKETARYNAHTHQVDSKLEAAVLRGIAGFLNAQGGTLIIGVNDSGALVGLDRDLKTLSKRPDLDGFQQFLRQLIKEGLGANASANVDVTFPTVDGVQLCAVRVSPSPTAVYTRVNGEESFFLRLGNTTQAMTMQEAHAYIHQHFK
jgi:predicted HTH transcriptional regulator